MSTTPDEPTSADWLAVVREKAANIRFGSIQITVHDGRVTQVEANEKTRIAPDRADAPAAPRPPKK